MTPRVEESVAELEDPDFARGKIFQDGFEMFLEEVIRRGFGGSRRFFVLDKIAQNGIFFFVSRRFKR